MTGQLKTPPVFDDFDYRAYLAKDGTYSQMGFPAIAPVSNPAPASVFSRAYRAALLAKAALEKPITLSFSPDKAAVMEGLVFGDDKNILQPVQDQFRAAGLSHLTAVSGGNIVILISVTMVCLLALGLWRQQAFYGSAMIIWLYIAMIGFPVSGVRAALMGCAGLLAERLGRQNTSSRVIVLAASLMLLQNPMLLWYDVSFQLSFLASLGIIYAKPAIEGLCLAVSKGRAKVVVEMISITFAAQLFTLPVLASAFGSVSWVSPVTNLLVLPAIPALTVMGIAVALLGLVSGPLAWLVSLPCWFLLTYLGKVLALFGSPSFLLVLPHAAWWLLAGYYAALWLLLRVWRIQVEKQREYWRGSRLGDRKK
jgi:competence protein ComEC